MNDNKTIFYAPETVPPLGLLVFSSVQHLFLVLSLGLALPVTIAKTAGLSPHASSIFLSLALLSIGFTGIIQTIPNKYLGNGRMDLSVSDSAALSACTFAASIGGMPLVYGMTVLSGIFKTLIGSFTYQFRKLFPPEVTGSMIFILGISIVPTGLKYFLGTKYYEINGSFSPTYIMVSFITFMVIFAFTIFSAKLKPYAVLFGLIVGYILSLSTGILDFSAFSQLKSVPFFQVPCLTKFEYAFSWQAVIPFAIVTVAAIVDNIGDYSAAQKISDPNFKRPNWRLIENGIRSSGIGTLFAGLIGGVIQSTATANIGIAGATGITSRVVAYLTSAMLMVLAFFPQFTGILMMIPEPVLGAILAFSITYIMAGGFGTLASVELDDRKIFVIFISIIFSVSTLIPSLWTFVPPKAASILVTPLVLGTLILLFMTVLTNLGIKKQTQITSKVDASAIPKMNEKLKNICKEWGVSKDVCQNMIYGLDGIAESFCVQGMTDDIIMDLSYDRMQICINLAAQDECLKKLDNKEELPFELEISLTMLRNRFDNVHYSIKDDRINIKFDTDI